MACVLVAPFPKVHEYAVIDPVEELEKLTASGALPVVVVAAKPATGAEVCAGIVAIASLENELSSPEPLYAVTAKKYLWPPVRFGTVKLVWLPTLSFDEYVRDAGP